MKVQVNKEHYFKNYDTLPRFISYFYQVDLVKKLEPKKILEIGVGNKTVSNYLKNRGYDITTCDFDKDLKPDIIADIRNLPFKKNSYDLITAYEILEHIPYKDAKKCLKSLSEISKKYVIVSLPYSSIYFEFILRFPLIKKIFKKFSLNFFFRIPLFFKKIEFKGEHYWEIGRRGYSLNKIRKEIKKYFKIEKEVRPILNDYHYFFVLKSKIKI